MAATQDRRLTVRADRTISDPTEERRLLRQLILKNASEEQTNLVIGICDRYGFDPMLKHVVIVSNNLYVTRDGLLHLAHQSGQFDGIEVEMTQLQGGEWVATCTVYRKDMSRPIRYSAFESEHKPANTANSAWAKYPRAMLQKCSEVMALRRAFDVSIGAAEEIGYDGSNPQTNVGRVTVIEAAPAQLPGRGTVVHPQPAPPPRPAQPLAEAAYQEGVDAFLACAEDGYSLSDLRKQITDWDPALGAEQRAEIRAHWAAIKEHREQERAARLAPGAVAQEIIEAVVTVAPQPQTAAALAASDDPFLDRAQDGGR